MAPAPDNSSATNSPQGVAGRTDYGTWDKLTKELLAQTEIEEQTETEQSKQQLGHDNHPFSKDHADELQKARKLKQTKKKLDGFKKREQALVTTISNVFQDSQIKRLTQNDLEAGQRVVRVTDCHGTSTETSKLILTQDLSNLVSAVSNKAAKQYAGDVENDAPAYEASTQVCGLIKVFLENLSQCTVYVKCKLISGTIEMHRCHHVKVVMCHTATVATFQVDTSSDIQLVYDDVPSGKSSPSNFVPWGDDGDDRIFHAGCTDLTIQVHRDGVLFASLKCDYQADGAVAIGNATPEEYQFVTSMFDETLRTEHVVRTHTHVKPMTERDLKQAEARKQQIASKAVALADEMIEIKDKEGNVLVTKHQEEQDAPVSHTDPHQKVIIEEVNQLKARGNEAFSAGEYGQAILHYSLGLDKVAELGNDDHNNKYPVEVLYANRSAAFLKLGDHDKALLDADAALERNPQHLKAIFRKGLALHAAKRYQEALPILAEAHKLEPHNKQIKQALQFCEVRLQMELRERMNQ